MDNGSRLPSSTPTASNSRTTPQAAKRKRHHVPGDGENTPAHVLVAPLGRGEQSRMAQRRDKRSLPVDPVHKTEREASQRRNQKPDDRGNIHGSPRGSC